MLPKLKNIIIFSIIAVIIVLVYIFFLNPDENQESLIPSSPLLPSTTSSTPSSDIDLSTQDNDALSQSFLSLLLGVQGITLNDSIFKEGSVFYSLSDSSISLIPDGTEGRPNPFAPIGNDPSLFTPSPSSIQVITPNEEISNPPVGSSSSNTSSKTN